MTEKHKKLLSILSLILFVVFMVVVFWFAGRPMIKLVESPDTYRAWIEGKGILAQLSFIGMVFFQVIVAIIPGEPLEICAGYAFGALEGTVLSLIGIALGSAVVFLLVRTLGVKLVEVFFPIEKIQSMRFLKDSKKRNTLVFIIMLIPGTPKDLLSYFVGLTEMKLSEWLIITTIARIPSVATSTIGGNALGEGNYITAIAVFAVTAVVSILGILIYNAISKKRETRKAEKQEEKAV